MLTKWNCTTKLKINNVGLNSKATSDCVSIFNQSAEESLHF